MLYTWVSLKVYGFEWFWMFEIEEVEEEEGRERRERREEVEEGEKVRMGLAYNYCGPPRQTKEE